MYDLAKHIVEDHGARNILYIGGTQDYPENIVRLKVLCDVAATGFERLCAGQDVSRESLHFRLPSVSERQECCRV